MILVTMVARCDWCGFRQVFNDADGKMLTKCIVRARLRKMQWMLRPKSKIACPECCVLLGFQRRKPYKQPKEKTHEVQQVQV